MIVYLNGPFLYELPFEILINTNAAAIANEIRELGTVCVHWNSENIEKSPQDVKMYPLLQKNLEARLMQYHEVPL